MMAPMDMFSGKSKAGSSLLLVLASFIWGIAFVAQSKGMQYVGPFTFSAVRTLIAALTLIPCALLFDKLGLSPKDADLKKTIRCGVLLGLVLFAAISLQQVGLLYTSVAKAGFITSLYIVLVPFFGMAIGKRTSIAVWLCIPLAVAGLYLLSIQSDLSINLGDLLMIACAVGFACQILLIDRFARGVDVIRMSCVQFLTVSVLSFPCAFLLEKPVLADIGSAWLPILYAGALSGGFAYTMQMLGQRNIEPAIASLLMSPESVFAALAGWLLLGQSLTLREFFGCCLVFCAVILAQFPWNRVVKNEKLLQFLQR